MDRIRVTGTSCSGKTTLARALARVLAGTGNRERLSHILRRDGLLWWILSTHRRRRRTTAAELAARSTLQRVRLRSPAEAERWLRDLQPASSASTTAGASASAQNP